MLEFFPQPLQLGPLRNIQLGLKALDADEPQSSGKGYKIDCRIVQGIDAEKAVAASTVGCCEARTQG